jgi:uncharacterized membrane protein YjjP (DUF1212 family)
MLKMKATLPVQEEKAVNKTVKKGGNKHEMSMFSKTPTGMINLHMRNEVQRSLRS